MDYNKLYYRKKLLNVRHFRNWEVYIGGYSTTIVYSLSSPKKLKQGKMPYHEIRAGFSFFDELKEKWSRKVGFERAMYGKSDKNDPLSIQRYIENPATIKVYFGQTLENAILQYLKSRIRLVDKETVMRNVPGHIPTLVKEFILTQFPIQKDGDDIIGKV